MFDPIIYQIATENWDPAEEGLINPFYKERHKIEKRLLKENKSAWDAEKKWRKDEFNAFIKAATPIINKNFHININNYVGNFSSTFGTSQFLTSGISYGEDIFSFECFLVFKLPLVVNTNVNINACNDELQSLHGKFAGISNIIVSVGEVYNGWRQQMSGDSYVDYYIEFNMRPSDKWCELVDTYCQ